MTGCCFIHPPLIFATESLIYHYRILLSIALVCLAKVCEKSVLFNVIKDRLLIVSYFAELINKTLILNSLSR